jgi:hypothetical protein
MAHVLSNPPAVRTGIRCARLSRLRSTILSAVVLLSIPAGSVFSQTDIEINFVKTNSVDLSGTYTVSGLLVDSSAYNGTLKLEQSHTLTTPKGNTLQSFKMEYKFGEETSNGVAVYDGTRLYYASGPGDMENYYLLLLSKLEFSAAARQSLAAYEAANSHVEEGKYIDWEGDDPWYGYLSAKTQTYGLWFWNDGTWGQFATSHGNGFPLASDSGWWKALQLEEDGTFGEKFEGRLMGYWESGDYWTEPAGENLLLMLRHTDLESDSAYNNYHGTGMMTVHPRTGDSMLVAIMGGPDGSTVGMMEVSGKTITGVWAPLSGDARGTEIWQVPDDVVARNPSLFK